jgi:hypothetical protein
VQRAEARYVWGILRASTDEEDEMAELSEEQLRIRGYLQGQAAKLSPLELMTKVRADSQQLRAAAEAAAAVDVTKQPSGGEWSVNEVLQHLHDASRRVNTGIVAAALKGERPAGLRDVIEATADVREPVAWYDAIAAERETMFATISELSGEENLAIRWDHPFFGDLNWREWLLFLRLHDLDHAGQVRSVVEALS